MAAHLSALVAIAGLPFGHVLGPLIVYLTKGHESEFVAGHARASLNYQITVTMALIVFVIIAIAATVAFAIPLAATNESDSSGATAAGLTFVGFWVAIGGAAVVVLLLSLVFIIRGAYAASNGEPYEYPFAIRFFH